MSRKSARPVKKLPPGKTISLAVVLPVILLAVLLPASGFTFAAVQESHDAFCGSCHTQPESTYLQRSTGGGAVDLASYHTGHETRCIDCHSGAGIFGRVEAEMMGAGNALKWYSGTAVQPAPLTRPIGDEHCLKCHQKVTERGYVPQNEALSNLGDAENGHWHLFLSRWQAQSSSAGTCVSCHKGHATDGSARILFLNEQQTGAVCDSCHRVLGDD